MLDLFKNKSYSVLNPTLPDDTDRSFLSGLMGEEEEERDYQNQVSSANSSLSEWERVFHGSQFGDMFKPNTANDSSSLQHTVNNNPDAPLTLARLSDTSKSSGIINYNKHIYTSQNRGYTYRVSSPNGIINKDCYYIRKDGKLYPANSEETGKLTDWKDIDTDFLENTFVKLIDEANKKPTGLIRIFTQSLNGGELDFKEQLDETKLYMINGVLYNKNEAGNFMWAYFLESKRYSGQFSGMLAQGGTLADTILDKNKETRLDEEWDRRARWAGIKYYYEKNGMPWLYYYLYWNKLKY